MKTGDMILYDKFGSSWPELSPSNVPDDFALGVIVEILRDPPGRDDDSCAVVMKEDGSTGTFSLSYLVDLGHFG